ncbi:MAG: ice-binding family protein [Sideroxydans sp.]
MKNIESIINPLKWIIALLLAVFVVACGSGGGTPASASKDMTAYSLAGVTGTITGSSIAVTMPHGTNVTALIATFTTTGANLKVGTSTQSSGTTTNNFTAPVIYTVTAEDGTTATYTVSVNVSVSSANAMTTYSLAGISGTINKTAKTIAVTLPFGSSTTQVATFTSTGMSVKVGTVMQVSGITANDFTAPVAYIVTSADGTPVTYTVTVNVALITDKAITAYSIGGVAGIISGAASPFSIAVTVPNGTAVTSLIATLTSTGQGQPKVLGVNQLSGTTANNFTGVVAYTVTAADTSTSIYNVTVIVSSALGPAAVNLGTAGSYVILAKTGVSTTGTTAVTGDIGLSPAAATYITGFSLIADATNVFSTSSLVTGNLYAANYAVPTPSNLTTAIGDMEIAFTDAAGRSLPDHTELGAGDISGMTLTPGLYKWSSGVLITSAGVTLTGGPNDVWIFQIAQNLTVNNAARVTLAGGALAKNIFWQVSGQATLGTTANFKGIILSQTLISMNTGAVLNGRALSQTAVTLDANAVTQP